MCVHEPGLVAVQVRAVPTVTPLNSRIRQQLHALWNRRAPTAEKMLAAAPRATRAPTASAAAQPEEAAGRPTLYFHIGAPKTGTTYLQRILWRNREALHAEGVLYPGDSFGAHVQAALDLRQTGFAGVRDPLMAGRWREFVDAARAWSGPVIFSQELFSPAEPSQIDDAMAALDFADVHLIYTARELSRQIPAAWQEDVKNRFTVRFDDFMNGVRDPTVDEHGLGQMFWRMQDAVEVLARWAGSIPPDRIHVVTVSSRGGPPDELWQRFASVVGIDPGWVDLGGAFQNFSLGAAEATFLRRLNLALDDEVGWPLYNEVVKHHLAQEVLVNRGKPIPIKLSATDRMWAADRSVDMVEGLRGAGYDIVGSLDDLLPTPSAGGSGDTPDEPPVEAQLDVALEAIAALLLRISRQRRGIIPR